MNLSAEDVAKVRLAGLLHDVGTLGNRRGSSDKREAEMTTNELVEFHAHPVRGEELFNSLEDLQDVGKMVRGHHEAFNGGGFPDGLKEDDIPLGARLIAIANAIEHAASSVSDERDEYALMVVHRQSGTLLDPRLISYFTMITRIMYFERKKSGTTGEVEVPPNELISGMQLSRDLSNEAGVLLLQKGDKLDSGAIALIRRMIQPSEGGVWMYVKNSE
jgi:response regulator RpfG family c-di-GMP phosphodiesterase